MEDIVDMDDGYDEERNGIGNLTELDFRVMYDVDGRCGTLQRPIFLLRSTPVH